MRVKQKLNNNAVLVYDEKDNLEKIAIGKGLGFRARIYECIDVAQIDKIYTVEDKVTYKKFAQVLKTIPEQYIALSEEIISYTEKTLGVTLNAHVYISLTDHIAFAIERIKINIPIHNKLLNEIKILYKEEYAIGLWAVKLIEECLEIDFPEDEAGFIALHIHTIKLKQDHIAESLQTATIIKSVVELIAKDLNVEIDDQTIAYHRLITHLQFALQRAIRDHSLRSIDADIFEMIKQKYVKEYCCAIKIGLYVKKEYGLILPESELVYMTLHIKTISSHTD